MENINKLHTAELTAEGAAAEARRSRLETMYKGCGQLADSIFDVIGEAVAQGAYECRTSNNNVRTAAAQSAVQLLLALGYEVTNVSSVNPQSPFELRIRWGDAKEAGLRALRSTKIK